MEYPMGTTLGASGALGSYNQQFMNQQLAAQQSQAFGNDWIRLYGQAPPSSTITTSGTTLEPTHQRVMSDRFLDCAEKVYRVLKTKMTFVEYCDFHMTIK